MPTRLHLGLVSVLGLLGLGCTVEGEDVMTTFADPTVNPSGNPATGDEGDTEPAETSSATESGSDDVATTTPTTTDPSDSDGTGPGVDEQPVSGMYSPCMTVGDCIGQTTCVIVPDAPMGFCSRGCTDPATDCAANPGATSDAAPACVDNAGMQVCALSCQGGLTCPGGMECLSLGATMVCV